MINEAALLLLLLSVGGHNGATQDQVINKLENLVETQVTQESYKSISKNCQSEISLIDYMITSKDKIVVDYDLVAVGEHQDCQEISDTYKGEQFCRAIFTKDEQLERVNCR